MAKVKVKREGNLLWEDECQPLTNEQMTEIKSQFHPSNTANVNIVPYEIYDEDGEEIRVGEVRKTIDGVKKKKPLYRKVLIVNNPTTATQYDIQDADYLTIENIQFYSDVNGIVYIFTGKNATDSMSLTRVAVNMSNNAKGVYVDFKGSWDKLEAIVKYTKTTDEWTAV